MTSKSDILSTSLSNIMNSINILNDKIMKEVEKDSTNSDVMKSLLSERHIAFMTLLEKSEETVALLDDAMLPDEYQEKALTTIDYGRFSDEMRISYAGLGLANEAGEVAGKVKKYFRDEWKFSRLQNEVEGELGDVMWYIAVLAAEIDLSLEEIMKKNIEKLADRKERGVIRGSGDNR